MAEINIKITNAKQLIGVLKDIQERAKLAAETTSYYGFCSYYDSLNTLIKVLEEAK